MENKDQVLEERRIKRHAASGYQAGIVSWKDLVGWMQHYLPSQTRQGRLTADLVVTMEAFDNCPGDDIQQFRNALGETVYRKKVRTGGAVTGELRLLAIDSEGFYVDEPNQPLRRASGESIRPNRA